MPKNDSRIDVSSELENLLSSLNSRFPEHESLRVIDVIKGPLDDLCGEIESNRDKLFSIHSTLRSIFEDSLFVTTELDNQPGSLSIFPALFNQVARPISGYVNEYHKISSEYIINIQGFLGTIDNPADSTVRNNHKHSSQTYSAAKKAMELVDRSTNLFIKTRLDLPKITHSTKDIVTSYNEYLQDRFVDSERDDGPRNMIEMMQRMHNDRGPRSDYVKVKLIEDNPLLTDVLLNVIDILPEFRKSKVGKKESKILSKYGVEEASMRLAALSDVRLLHYLNEPTEFFRELGQALEKFYEVTKALEPYHRKFLEMEHAIVITNIPPEIEQKLKGSTQRILRDIKVIKSMDLDSIIQNPDKILPDNRREVDYFKLREKMFETLITGLHELSEIRDTYTRAENATDLVKQTVEIKDNLKDILITERDRKLRKDKDSDNEFYVGRQGEVGRFYFDRKPAPEVKLDDVIGKSFDSAKDHLNQVIGTGVYSRLMKLTAPGGKVRSNLLLIGPYGCGKTELARGVCSDKRVIGASVSVANTLTAYMHESVNNIKRIYDAGMELRHEARDLKPVVLVLDEFDAWFKNGSSGTHTETDMAQIQDVLLEVLDGMEDYNGIITMAMTNKPREIPDGIIRRFRYVDVVGQLNESERGEILKLNLERRMPLHEDVSKNYQGWAKRLIDAPGDVVRKVIDEVHFAMVPRFISQYPVEADRIERVLYKRENKEGSLTKKDTDYIKGRLTKYDFIVTPDHVNKAIEDTLKKPPIQLQIKAARELYKDSELLLEEISQPRGFGLKRRSAFFDATR